MSASLANCRRSSLTKVASSCSPGTPNSSRVTIQALAEEPLLVALLHGARSEVVDDGVAEHVIERVFAFDVLGMAADHHAKLAFVVDRVGRVQGRRDFLTRIGERGGRLGEDHRIGRHLLLVAGLIDAALGEFAGVVVIILADADHVLGERADRGGELGAGERDRLAVFRRRAGGEQLDDMAQIAQRAAADRKRAKAVALDGAENLALRGVDGCNSHDLAMTFPYGRMTFRLADKPLAKTGVRFKAYRPCHSGARANGTALSAAR